MDVNGNDIRIIRLTPADAALYREVRLDGLNRNPEAFGSTFASESAKPLAWFGDRLAGTAVFGAFRDPELLGTAGLAFRPGEKEAHKGLLWGMYVRPEARGAGIARRLVEAVIEFARPRLELIQLSVVIGNEQARRLYAALGFVEYGIEKNSLKQRGRYYDETLMALDLAAIATREVAASRSGAQKGSVQVSAGTPQINHCDGAGASPSG